MPINGPSSYVPTLNEFLRHWPNVNTALGAPLVLPGGATLLSATEVRDELEDFVALVQGKLNDVEIGRGQIEILKLASLERIGEFNRKVRGFLGQTAFVSALPDVPSITSAAARFIEPLEATALMLVQDTIEQFIAAWAAPGEIQAQRTGFNQKVNLIYDSIRDYIFMHYKLNSRDDTPYWVAARDNVQVSDSVGQVLEIWDQGGDLLAEIRRQQGQMAYSPTSWFCILAGMGRFPHKPRRATGKHQAVDPNAARQQCLELLRYFPDHRQSVNQLAHSAST